MSEEAEDAALGLCAAEGTVNLLTEVLFCSQRLLASACPDHSQDQPFRLTFTLHKGPSACYTDVLAMTGSPFTIPASHAVILPAGKQQYRQETAIQPVIQPCKPSLPAKSLHASQQVLLSSLHVCR